MDNISLKNTIRPQVCIFFILVFLLSGIIHARQPQFDTVNTDIAAFIAGKPRIKYFDSIATYSFYQTHKTRIDDAWHYVKRNDLNPVKRWRAKNTINQPSVDPNVVFYPFSGPDFLFVNTFFPNAHTYIMGGLEDRGTLPPLDKMSVGEIREYLSAVRHSLRYINKAGYFVTKHMMEDFNSQYLNGNLHVILYYLARTGHRIGNITYFYLEKNGEIGYDTENAGNKHIRGMAIEFFDEKFDSGTIYYLNADLSDESMSNHPEISAFIKGYGKNISYVKSGSYLLHRQDFSMLRDLILERSTKILQDDTGIPFNILEKHPEFNITLYGSYSKTIADFEDKYQPALEKALDKQNPPKLEFKIGYNSWHDETLLMYAYRDSAAETVPADTNRVVTRSARQPADNSEDRQETRKTSRGSVVFRVQIHISRFRLSPENKKFKNVKDVHFYKEDGVYKYTAGNFEDYEACKKYKNRLRENGFPEAFVVSFLNTRRIPVDSALEVSAKN